MLLPFREGFNAKFGENKVLAKISEFAVLHEYVDNKANNMHVPYEDSDQPAHAPCLVRVSAMRAIDSYGTNRSFSTQRCADVKTDLRHHWAQNRIVYFVTHASYSESGVYVVTSDITIKDKRLS